MVQELPLCQIGVVIVNIAKMSLSITIERSRWGVRRPLPARSLRGHAASLRTLPERAALQLATSLIWWAFSRNSRGSKRVFSLLSGRRTLRIASAQQDLLFAGQHELVVLVVDGG